MTISTELRKAGPFTGNGVTTAFPFSFKVFAASDVAVTRADPLGAETALVLNSDFTVALNPDQDAAPGGTVTLAAPLATGHRLAVTSVVPNLQPTDITNNGGFYPRVIEDALDRHVAQIQQIDEKVDRALKVAITSTLGDQALPSPVAGMLIGWNESNDGLKNYAPIGGTLLGQQLAAAYGSSLVGFQQAGTGAGVRTAQDKLREFKSIADYLPVGYVSDGSVFYTAEIQKALDENSCLELPEGVFKHGRLVLKHQGQIIRGKGRGISVLYCPAGYGITNFSGADSDPVGADWVGNPTLEKLTLRGGFTHTDDFSPPANSWASATGRSKPFTTTDINAGLRLKRCYPYTLNEVNIEKFHRGVYVSAAALGRFNNFEISDCQYGMYGENGAVWGEAAWQVTTHRWSQGRFRNCWIGIGGSDYVQCQIDKKTVDFEPCNSGISVFNGGDNVWSGYFELCSEGIYRDGGDMGHDVIEDPFFAGSPGAFWGSGDSILLDSGIGLNGKVTLRHGLGKINGGGLRVLGGRLVQPEREKIGATVYLSPALTPAGGYTATDISWATVSASDDVLGLFSAGAPTRLTIPAALNGARVRLKSTLTIDGDATANDVLVEFKKNGASFAGKGRFAGTFAYGKTVSFETAPVTVATGDYFTVGVAMNLSRTLSTGDQCWLALEVLE